MYGIASYQLVLVFQHLTPSSSFNYHNKFYSVSIGSYVNSLHLQDTDIVATFKVFSLEQYFNGQWMLEKTLRCNPQQFDNCTLLRTGGQLLTYETTKFWLFFPDKPYFKLEINKLYNKSAWSWNNQLIIDVNNKAIHSNLNFSFSHQHKILDDKPTWVLFDCEPNGVFAFIILGTNDSNLHIQFPPRNGTEVQINFDGAGDRTLCYHEVGKKETVSFLVYANQNMTATQLLEASILETLAVLGGE